MTEATTIPPRAEIALEHRWNAESVFATRADWENAREEVGRLIEKAAEYRGRLDEGPEVLLGWFQMLEDLM